MTPNQRAAKKRQKARRKQRKRLAREKVEQSRKIHGEAIHMTTMGGRQFLKEHYG